MQIVRFWFACVYSKYLYLLCLYFSNELSRAENILITSQKRKRAAEEDRGFALYIHFCHSPLSPEFTAGRMAHFILRMVSALDVTETGNCDNARLDCFLDEHRLAFGTEKHLVCFILGCWTNLDLRLHLRIGRIENRAPAGRTPRDGELSFQLRSTFPSRCDTHTATPWIRNSASTGMSGYFCQHG